MSTRADLMRWVKERKIVQRKDIPHGFEAVPNSLLDSFSGRDEGHLWFRSPKLFDQIGKASPPLHDAIAVAPTTQAESPLVGTAHRIASGISCSLAPAVRAPLIWTAAQLL